MDDLSASGSVDTENENGIVMVLFALRSVVSFNSCLPLGCRAKQTRQISPCITRMTSAVPRLVWAAFNEASGLCLRSYMYSAVLVSHRIIASTAVRDNVFGMKTFVLLLSRVADIPSISQSPVLWNAELIRRLCVLRCVQIRSDRQSRPRALHPERRPSGSPP
jgi:hypothetical protein